MLNRKNNHYLSPIGVIDSGVGGLSVWRHLVTQMPNESYLYFGDSGNCPYGSKSPEEITKRVSLIVDFLLQKECKVIVVACNAITAASIAILRKNYPIPFIGMEPAVKPAAENTKTGKIGILTTPMTSKGTLFKNTCNRYAANVEVYTKIGEGLVELVESGDIYSENTVNKTRVYIEDLLNKGVDQIVLGCTHYPFLRETIEKIAGNGITIIDPAPAVAVQTCRILKNNGLLTDSTAPGHTQFYTTGKPTILKTILSILSIDNPEIISMGNNLKLI